MKIFVDVDETICYNEDNDKSKARDYSKSVPIKENIQAVNSLYEQGHEITYWTKKQLMSWGAKHHDLILGKPAYDLYIDDKSINTRRWEETGRCISIPEQ